MLGAPYEICWQTQCINYSFKKKQEEQWEKLINEYVSKIVRKNYAT